MRLHTLGGQEPGRGILYPVATVILGCLVTSTYCEFLIHPGVFWNFSGQNAKRLAQLEESEETLRTHLNNEDFGSVEFASGSRGQTLVAFQNTE